MNEIKRYPSYTHITWVATLLLFMKDINCPNPSYTCITWAESE